MAKRICKACDRSLTEEDGEYCPHCNAKRAGKVGKAGSIGTAIIGLLGAGLSIWKIFNKK